MAVSKAQQRAVTKYDAKAYDKTLLRIPKGRLDILKNHAATRGESVNGFISRAISETMERDSGGASAPSTAPAEQVLAEVPAKEPQEAAGSPIVAPTGAGVVSLSTATLKTAQKAAEAEGEAVPVFITRAIETQAQRDALSRHLSIKAEGRKGKAKQDKSSLSLEINPATGEKLNGGTEE